MPEWVYEEPILLPHHGFYIRAFFHLSKDRQFAPGIIGPIPWSSIVDYADRCGFEGPTQDLFLEVISAMDNHYLEDQAKQLESHRRHAKAQQRNKKIK